MAGLEGKTLNHYELRRLIGRGGMADVYEAVDLTNQRTVAVKLFKREDEEMLQRFIREAKLMRSLNNPHLVPIFDSGTSVVDGMTCYYIVMPFLPGGTLRTRIRRGGAMPLQEVCRDLKDIASALDYIHNQGIIHRDIKASNVLLNADGRCYLSDFGIARIASEATQLTSTGNVLGTVDYVAPELFEVHRRADAISDLYSLGVLLYEMVTGKLPFSAENQIALVSMHMNKPPPPPHSISPHVSPQVERVMLKALEKKPEMRYGSATELANAFCSAVTASHASSGAPQGDGAGESQAPLVLPAVDAGQLTPVYTPSGARDVPVYDYATVVGATPYAAGTPLAQDGQGYQGTPAVAGTPARRGVTSPTPRTHRSNYQRNRRIVVIVLALVMVLIVIVLPSVYFLTHPLTNNNPAPSPTQSIVSSPSAATSPTVTPSPTPNLTATAQAVAAMTATAQAHATQTAIAGATATVSAQASATAGVIQTATAGTPTYEDALNDATSTKTQAAAWDGIDGSNDHCKFQSDGYHVTEGSSLRGCRESAYNYKNGTISVDVVMVSGHSGGLFFRVNPGLLGAYSGYLFEIDSNGQYRIRASDNFNLNTNTQTLQDWTASPALKTGYNVKNTLQVIMNGSTLLFYANGVFLTKVQDSTYTSGNIALGAFASGGNTEVVYSNIKVYPLS